MKPDMRFLILAALAATVSLSAFATTAPLTAQSSAPAGQWTGALEGPNRQIGIAVTFEKADSGWTGSIDIPSAGVRGFRLSNVTVEGDHVRFEMVGLPGPPVFDGQLSDSGQALTGTLREGMEVLDFAMRRAAEGGAESPQTARPVVDPAGRSRAAPERTGPKRPQTPVSPFPYQSHDVTFRNEAGDVTIAGTLVIPEREGPFPAVIFVSGSGPQDRDETVAGHKPFLVAADYLARRGIASLRYDDRGVGGSTGSTMTATHADLAGDIVAAVEFLRGQPAVDSSAIGVIGHSEGGLTGPRAAVAEPRIDFLVLLAGPGEPLDELTTRQTRAALTARGVGSALIERVIATAQEDYALAKDESIGRDELVDSLTARMRGRRSSYTDAELAILQVNETSLEIGIRQLSTPWMRSLLREDPAVHLRAVRVPVLALFGGKDVQVNAAVNAPLVERALRAAGNADFVVHTFPDMNHLFQRAGTGAITEYYSIEETIAPEVLELIGDWIREKADRATGSAA